MQINIPITLQLDAINSLEINGEWVSGILMFFFLFVSFITFYFNDNPL